jgi:hypothetical protein
MAEQRSALCKFSTLLGLFLLTGHSFLMNGYYLSHPFNVLGSYTCMVNALLDPSLFRNSFFIEAVERTGLRISYFYDLLPYLTTVDGYEKLAMALSFLSLFFIFTAIFALTELFAGKASVGFLAVLLYTYTLNSWTLGSPAPYLIFFHAGISFSIPLLIWSMVLFFKERYPLSLLLAGISFGFHPMCTVFFLTAYFFYGLYSIRKIPLKTFFWSACAFFLPAMPVFIRTFIQVKSSSEPSPMWLTGVEWNAAYTCFPSTWGLSLILRAGLFFTLFLVCLGQLKDRTLVQKIWIFLLPVAFLCLLGTVFADIWPVPFIIKTSLWRSTSVYLYLALPCIAVALNRLLDRSAFHGMLALSIIVLLCGYTDRLPVFYMPLFILFMAATLYEDRLVSYLTLLKDRLSITIIITLTALLVFQQITRGGNLWTALLFLAAYIWLALTVPLAKHYYSKNSRIACAVLFIVIVDAIILYARGGPVLEYQGVIQRKVYPWADIQQKAKQVSEKDDLFIVPPYLQDFSLYSQRAVLGDWGEGSYMIYLDRRYTEDWFARMADLGWEKKLEARKSYDQLSTDDIIAVGLKYGASFVVTEKPKTFKLKKIYENKKFILYRIPTSIGHTTTDMSKTENAGILQQ